MLRNCPGMEGNVSRVPEMATEYFGFYGNWECEVDGGFIRIFLGIRKYVPLVQAEILVVTFFGFR